MKVLFVSSEVVPFAKTGGLADVAGTLPPALRQLGIDIRVVMPYYRSVRERGYTPAKGRRSLPVERGDLQGKAQLRQTSFDGVPIYFIDFPEAFDRPGLYGEGGTDYPDNDLRFGFFARAVMELLRRLDFRPDLIHLNDWQAALIPVLLKTERREDLFFRQTKSLLSIHNLGYQGLFPEQSLGRLDLPARLFAIDKLEYYGQCSFLKGGILHADMLNTVSPSYAREILTPEFGAGFDGILGQRQDRLHGILNGLDNRSWDPALDPCLPSNYSAEDLRGKATNKKRLQEQFGLPCSATTPLLGMVGRFDRQKGIDLLCEAWGEIVQRDLQLVILGSGDPRLESDLQALSGPYRDRVALKVGFDEPLARLIYAGSDLFLMPSRYEPCGLSQLIALRYGSVPLVRRTGGLADTIRDTDADPRHGNGFTFTPARADALVACVDRALESYRSRRNWLRIVRRGMLTDHSWHESARAYLNLYQKTMDLPHAR